MNKIQKIIAASALAVCALPSACLWGPVVLAWALHLFWWNTRFAIRVGQIVDCM